MGKDYHKDFCKGLKREMLVTGSGYTTERVFRGNNSEMILLILYF